MGQFINLTPHVVRIVKEGADLLIEPSGYVARVATKEEAGEAIIGIPVVSVAYGDIDMDGYAPQSGDMLIVAAMAAAAIKAAYSSNSVFSPNSGPGPNGAVRDEKGMIVGVRSLIRY